MYFKNHPDNTKRKLVMPGGHPNEIGHKIISEKLICELDCAIIQ
jgi:hypothetical protein